MSVFYGGVLSIESKLSTIQIQKPELIQQLALCLDREMRLIPNWKHLAREMLVDEDDIKRLERYSDYSPTIRLFDHLEVTQPDLTIQTLRKALSKIRRNDLCRLTAEAGCADDEKVLEVITSPNIQATSTSPRAGLLIDKMALALDATSLGNWYNLAMELGVTRSDCWKLKTRSTQSPTNQLFQYLETTRPQMTLKKLKEALQSMTRNDLLEIIQKQNLEDDVLLKDVMTPGSELLQTMADKLNRELPAVKNWKHLASQLEIPVDVRREFADESTGEKRKSPTIEVMERVAAQFPDTTLHDVVKALIMIERNDAVQLIQKQFPDTVDRLDSSLHDYSFRNLPINDDPTGVSRSCKREVCGPLLEHETQQPGHCGNLPDRTDLVGRDGTCEQIMLILTSNEAAEIVAPPGYGKTSVVVEVAHRMIKSGKFVAYVKTRGVTCVEDLGCRIIEALGAVPGEDTIQGTLRRISALKSKSVVLIIENIDNLLHLEDRVTNEKYFCAKVRGKYKKDDFLTFLKDIGQSSTIHLVLTSRETNDFSVSFPIELIKLQPLDDEDSATLFMKRDKSLDDSLVKELVSVCGGIPLIICTVLSILKNENPQKFTRRLSTSSLSSLIGELNPDYIADEDRIDKCLQVCFNRLNQENQDVLVMTSTFPHRFTQEQFLAVFKSSLETPDLLQTSMNCLKHSSLLRFDRGSSHYSLHPFMRDFFSLIRPKHTEAKSVFIRHYSDLAVTLCKQFLSKDSEQAIKHYRVEKENIREAMTWCGDDHPELDGGLRERCIVAFSKSAVFLAKMMRKQEFESLFCKLSYRCRHDMHLYSACLTDIGMKIVLSCTCTPHICAKALYRAKNVLSYANDIQSRQAGVNDATRAQCLSKLGFCNVREGCSDVGYVRLNQALTLRTKRAEQSTRNKDKVMLAACFNDLAASQMSQQKHEAAIETRLSSVLPVYESILGDHPFLATTLSWIANSYQALGDYDNAIKFNRRAFAIRKQLLGHHQETARSCFDLGLALSAKKDYEGALEHLQEAVVLQEEVLDTHEELILTHQAMSVAFRGLGREDEAEREIERAGECAKRLDSLDVSLERIVTCEEKEYEMVVMTSSETST